MRENRFMQLAIEQALIAEGVGEIPVGAVIVKDNEIIAEGYNTREADRDICGHAEINAIKAASKSLDNWRLENCDIYVTLEPCPMCAAAISQARIRAVYFGAYDKRQGACESMMRLYDNDLEHRPEFYGGIMEEKNREMLRSFFEKRRKD